MGFQGTNLPSCKSYMVLKELYTTVLLSLGSRPCTLVGATRTLRTIQVLWECMLLEIFPFMGFIMAWGQNYAGACWFLPLFIGYRKSACLDFEGSNGLSNYLTQFSLHHNSRPYEVAISFIALLLVNVELEKAKAERVHLPLTWQLRAGGEAHSEVWHNKQM